MHRTAEKRRIRCKGMPCSRGIWDRNHERHLPPEPLGECDALQLSRTQLRLKVPEASLDLDQQDVGGIGQDHVGRSTIWWGRYWYLESDAPGCMCRRSYHRRERQLPRVAEPDSISRIEAN